MRFVRLVIFVTVVRTHDDDAVICAIEGSVFLQSATEALVHIPRCGRVALDWLARRDVVAGADGSPCCVEHNEQVTQSGFTGRHQTRDLAPAGNR